MTTADQLNDEWNRARPYYCAECGASFPSLHELNGHKCEVADT